MAGKERKKGRGQAHGPTAGPSGSMSCTSPAGPSSKAHTAAGQQGQHSTAGSRTTGVTANRADAILQGNNNVSGNTASNAATSFEDPSGAQAELHLATAKGTFAKLVADIASNDILDQHGAAALLHALVHNGKAVDRQEAVEEGAIPPLVRLLQSTVQTTWWWAAAALLVLTVACREAVHMAAAAGAIPSLVGILASHVSASQQAGHMGDCEPDEATMLVEECYGPQQPVTAKQWQLAAVGSLCSIAASGNSEYHTAMLEAGAVAAISAAVCIQDEAVHRAAFDIFRHMLVDTSTRAALAGRLTSLLRDSRVATTLEHVATAVARLSPDPRFSSAFVAAGGVTALVPLLSNAPDPVPGWAAAAISYFATPQFQRQALAVVKARAIRPLAHLLLSSSDVQTREDSAVALMHISQHPRAQDQLTQVIPQLLQALQGNDTQVHVFVGRALQCLAKDILDYNDPYVRRAFVAVAPLWVPLLGPGCSEAQRYAAASIYYSILSDDARKICTATLKAMFRTMRLLNPNLPASQWMLISAFNKPAR